jgi:hypothetical protein
LALEAVTDTHAPGDHVHGCVPRYLDVEVAIAKED